MVNFDLIIPRDSIYEIPHRRGIYVFLSDNKIPLYVGKSVNINARVKSHLANDNSTEVYNNVEIIFEVGIIFCGDSDDLDKIEQQYISLLKPLINIDLVDYTKNINIATLKKHGPLSFKLCKHTGHNENKCNKISTRNGYCYYHNPNETIHQRIPSWVKHDKLITTEMQRLLFESEHSRQPFYFFMNNVTFGKLVSEKTFATIDYINEAIILKFKKHFIIIDEDETIRLEIRQPYKI